LNEEIKDTIFSMHFKIEKKMLMDRINERKSLYMRLRTLICKTFKEINEEKASRKVGRSSAPDQTDEVVDSREF